MSKCINCQKPLDTKPSLSKFGHFCSRSCAAWNRAQQKKHQTLNNALKKTKENTPYHRKKAKPLYNFYQSKDWLALRHEVLRLNGGKCVLCGVTASQLSLGVRLEVDHIKPRSIHPELSLSISNLQVLCSRCNRGKRNYDDTDWR